MWHNGLNQEITAFEKHVFDTLAIINRRIYDMAIDLSALKAAQAKVATDVIALISLAQTAISNSQDPTLQGQLDDITKGLISSTTAAEAELTSVASGVTGATGPATGTTGATGPTA